MGIYNQLFVEELIKANYIEKLHSIISSVFFSKTQIAKELIDSSHKLFESDISKIMAFIDIGYTSITLICELSDKELVEQRFLQGEGGIIKFTCQISTSGKISVELFKKVVNFLYVASKMSQKITEFLRNDHNSIIGNLTKALIKSELGTDPEFVVIISGLIFSVKETLTSHEEAPILKEILRIIKLIVTETNPVNDFNVSIGVLINQLKEEHNEKVIKEIYEEIGKYTETWMINGNANNVALEILAELFTSEDNQCLYEDDKMDDIEETKTMADSILDKKLVLSLIHKCENWITPILEVQIKSIKETGKILKLAEKIRMNAFGCLLNLIVNKRQELLDSCNEENNLSTLICASLKELESPKVDPRKSYYLYERISTFIKLSLETMGANLHLGITGDDAVLLSNYIQSETSEIIQLNLISALGCILKTVPHNNLQNKNCCSRLMSFGINGSLNMMTTVLNALFDIYSEETYNEVLKELKVIPLLSSSLTHYKNMV